MNKASGILLATIRYACTMAHCVGIWKLDSAMQRFSEKILATGKVLQQKFSNDAVSNSCHTCEIVE